jgi:hypothetical protein
MCQCLNNEFALNLREGMSNKSSNRLGLICGKTKPIRVSFCFRQRKFGHCVPKTICHLPNGTLAVILLKTS